MMRCLGEADGPTKSSPPFKESGLLSGGYERVAIAEWRV
jgi:hypothetical protein